MFFISTVLKLSKTNKKIYNRLKYLYKFKKEVFFNVYINKKKYLNILFNNSISFFKKSLNDYFNYLNWIKKYDLLIHKNYISKNNMNIFSKKNSYKIIINEKKTAFYKIKNKNNYVNKHKFNYFYNFTKKFKLLNFSSTEKKNDTDKAKKINTYVIRKEANEDKFIVTRHDNFYNALIYNKKFFWNHISSNYQKTYFYKSNNKNKILNNSLYNFIKKIYLKRTLYKNNDTSFINVLHIIIKFIYFINININKINQLIDDSLSKYNTSTNRLHIYIIKWYLFLKKLNIISTKENRKILLIIFSLLKKDLNIINYKIDYLENNLLYNLLNNINYKSLPKVSHKINHKNNIYNKIDKLLLKYVKHYQNNFLKNIFINKGNNLINHLNKILCLKNNKKDNKINISNNYEKNILNLSLFKSSLKYNYLFYENVITYNTFFSFYDLNNTQKNINNKILKYKNNFYHKNLNKKLFYKLINSILIRTNNNLFNINYNKETFLKYYNLYFKRHYSFYYYLLNNNNITFNNLNKYFIQNNTEKITPLYKKIYNYSYKNIFSNKKSPIYYYNRNRRFINLSTYISLKNKEYLSSYNEYNIRFYYKKIYLYYFFKWFNKTFFNHFLSILFNYVFYVKKERLNLKKRIIQYINLNNIGSIVYKKTSKNIFISLVNNKGDVLYSTSSGCIGYFWKKKTYKATLIKLTKRFLLKIQKKLPKYNIFYLKIIIKGNLSFIEYFFNTVHRITFLKKSLILKLKSTFYLLKKYFSFIKKKILENKKSTLINFNIYIKHLTFFYTLLYYLNSPSIKRIYNFKFLFMQLKSNKPFIK